MQPSKVQIMQPSKVQTGLSEEARNDEMVGWRNTGVASVVIALALCGLTAPVVAEPQPDQQLEQIKRIEKELQAIKKEGASEKARIAQLEKETAELKGALGEETGGEPRGLAEEHRATIKEKTAAADHVNYSAEWQVGTPQKYVPDRGWIGLKGARSEIKFWGWVQAALFHDFQENLANDVQEFSAGLVPAPTGDDPTTGFDMASSRLFIQSRHLLKNDNAVNVLFVMDGGGNDPFGGYAPRVRQFNVTINNLTFGKANGTFANGHTWPAYFDRGAPGAYSLARKPLIRYAIPFNKEHKNKSVFTIGVEEPTPKILDLDNATAAETVFEWPDIVARYDINPKWGNLMWAVIARDFVVESASTSDRIEEWSFGATMSGYVTIPKGNSKPKDFIKFGVMGGPGVGGYTWDTGFGENDAVYVDSTQTLETLDLLGGFVAYEANWSKRYFSTFILSYVDIDNIAIQSANSFNNTFTGTATFTYSPWEDTFVGLEYMYGKRENFDEQTGYDNRLNLVFRYMFNR